MTRAAVVTGGGTGIGRAIAEELVARGVDVVITGRREDVLEQAADEIGARAVAFDAADPGGRRRRPGTPARAGGRPGQQRGWSGRR